MEVEPSGSDPVKLSFARAKEYKKSLKQEIEGNQGLGSGGNGNGSGEAQEMPVSVKIALEKAKEYKKNKGVEGDSRSEAISGIFWENVEIEIHLFMTSVLFFFSFYFCLIPQFKQ